MFESLFVNDNKCQVVKLLQLDLNSSLSFSFSNIAYHTFETETANIRSHSFEIHNQILSYHILSASRNLIVILITDIKEIQRDSFRLINMTDSANQQLSTTVCAMINRNTSIDDKESSHR